MSAVRFVSPLRGLLAIVLGLVGHIASAQCASSTQVNQINCYNPQTQCQSSVTQLLPNFSEYGVMYTGGSVTCCSATYPSFVQQGTFGCNGSGKLADPAIRRRLIELARLEDIMISSCSGEYRPLTVALAEPPALKPIKRFDPKEMKLALTGIERSGQ